MARLVFLILACVLICKEVTADCVDRYSKCDDFKNFCHLEGQWQTYMSQNCQRTCPKHCRDGAAEYLETPGSAGSLGSTTSKTESEKEKTEETQSKEETVISKTATTNTEETSETVVSKPIEKTSEVVKETDETAGKAKGTETTAETGKETEATAETAETAKETESTAETATEAEKTTEVAKETEETAEVAKKTEETAEVAEETEQIKEETAETGETTEKTTEAVKVTQETKEVESTTEPTEEKESTPEKTEKTEETAETPKETETTTETVKEEEVTPKKQCGSSLITRNEILHGVDAVKGAWPWTVSIVSFEADAHFCGGSLIAPKWVLTSALCVERKLPSDIEVIAGDHNRYKRDGYEQYLRVKNITVHPSYVRSTFSNDIALLELESPVTLNEYANVVCLPSKDFNHQKGLRCVLPGWGTMSRRRIPAPLLQQAILRTVNTNLCFGESSHICAGRGADSLANVCRGDTGSSLVCQDDNGNWVQQGIAGFLMRHCNQFAAFTKVGDYLDWISSYISS